MSRISSNGFSSLTFDRFPDIMQSVDILMKQETKQQIRMSIADFHLPRYNEIPNVGLYLEQATKYVNQCISALGFENVTSTMIRNYVKHGLITNPVKKQYTADQIAHLIALALLKQVTPLEHINDLFQLLAQGGTYSVPVAYDYFCEELENILHFRFGLKNTIDEVGVTSSLEKEMLRSAVTAVSHIVYLNRCFLVLEEQKQENGISYDLK